MPLADTPTRGSVRVTFRWRDRVVGEGLFDSRALRDRPIAVLDIPDASAGDSDIASSLSATSDAGLSFDFDVIRVERAHANATVTGLLVLRCTDDEPIANH